MRLTKDEARILAAMLIDAKYGLIHDLKFDTKEQATSAAEALTALENKLQAFGKDKRRHGRTSINSFSDTFKRFVAASTRKDDKKYKADAPPIL